ncbi:hypothetical protein E2C01_090924 [Portunus trituberculatus]|uniref:Uncharacterized protein n=1 Tax=Portunus trituberculatus TaxID=210409 RepID=A0A5B7JCN0_PORTR|nr:hypothetical protein [Portunus trituberculatus]
MPHTVEQRSGVGLSSVMYIMCLMFRVQPCKFLLKNPQRSVDFRTDGIYVSCIPSIYHSLRSLRLWWRWHLLDVLRVFDLYT